MKIRNLLLFCTALLLPLAAQAQEMQWEDYEPKSRLVVPQNPVTKAKYPFIDVHAHQWRVAGMDSAAAATLIGEMDKMNMAVMVNLSGGSGEELVAKVQASERHFPGRMVHFANVDFRRIDEPNFGQNAAAQLEADVENGARGLKIFKSLGMYTSDSSGARVHTDDPRLDP
ncbi:MAG: amidohydrolase, partial [Rhodothermales bacterium]